MSIFVLLLSSGELGRPCILAQTPSRHKLSMSRKMSWLRSELNKLQPTSKRCHVPVSRANILEVFHWETDVKVCQEYCFVLNIITNVQLSKRVQKFEKMFYDKLHCVTSRREFLLLHSVSHVVLVTHCIYPRMARLSLSVHRRSPIPVLTGPGVEQPRWLRSTHTIVKGAITSKIKHAIKHKTSPARLAQLLQPSLACCFSLPSLAAS